MVLQLILCAVIGVYGVNAQLSTCSNDTENEMQLCFTSANSTVSLTTFLSFYILPNAAMCSIKEEFGSLTKCVTDVLVKCYSDIYKILLPTSEMNEKALNYFCDRKSSFDILCLTTAVIGNSSCLGSEPFNSSSFEGMKANRCRFSKNLMNCTRDSSTFDGCPETKETYLEVNKLVIPEACREEALDHPKGKTTPKDQSEGKTTSNDQNENTATTMDQSVLLLTTITLMKSIF